jgi:hypothetical protein
MTFPKLKAIIAGATALAALTATAPASALTIKLIDIGGVTGSKAQQGFDIAARYWESVLTNNVTMNIQVGFSALGPNILGGTRTTLQEFVPMQSYYSLLAANTNKSALDVQALANLSPLNANGGVQVLVPGYSNAATKDGVTAGYDSRLADTTQPIGNTIAIASSNYKALLNNNSNASGIDANIQFSSTFAFDVDPTDGISAGTYDFIGVAVHEIGHALGFLSGVEDFDASSGQTGFKPDDYWWGYAADMFRYSGTNKLDWTYGTDSYFSLDRGASVYQDGYWSTGSDKGDGWQASHWKEPNVACRDLRGIMNPYICGGVMDDAKALDLALLDAVGWNTNVNVTNNPGYSFSTAQMYRSFSSAVPEPASWAMMIFGMGAVGGALRRRCKVSTTVKFA